MEHVLRTFFCGPDFPAHTHIFPELGKKISPQKVSKRQSFPFSVFGFAVFSFTLSSLFSHHVVSAAILYHVSYLLYMFYVLCSMFHVLCICLSIYLFRCSITELDQKTLLRSTTSWFSSSFLSFFVSTSISLKLSTVWVHKYVACCTLMLQEVEKKREKELCHTAQAFLKTVWNWLGKFLNVLKKR